MRKRTHPRDVATEETVRFVTEHIRPKARVLEIGCGGGEVAAALGRKRKVVALDPSPEAVEAARGRGVDARVAAWPDFDAEGFDAVLFTRSLHHVERLGDSVRAAREALAPSGVVVVEDFAYSEADGIARQWVVDLARDLSASGVLTPAPGSLVERLLASQDPERTWMEEHGHGLHDAAAMEAALATCFEDVRGSRAPYLYRYFVDDLPPDSHGASVLAAALEMERALGPELAIGRRWVAR